MNGRDDEWEKRLRGKRVVRGWEGDLGAGSHVIKGWTAFLFLREELILACVPVFCR